MYPRPLQCPRRRLRCCGSASSLAALRLLLLGRSEQSLLDAGTAPFLAPVESQAASSTKEWVLFSTNEKEGQGAVPSRDLETGDSVRGVPQPPVSQASCEDSAMAACEQEQAWRAATDWALRTNPQHGYPLSVGNFVPRTDSSWWQATAKAPCRALLYESARAALACCNRDSSMVDNQDERGRAVYAPLVSSAVRRVRGNVEMSAGVA